MAGQGSGSGAEPFPLLNGTATATATDTSAAARRRRKSTGPSPDGRTGSENNNQSLATSFAHLNGNAHHKHAQDSNGTAQPGSKRLSKRRKARSMVRRVRQFALKHTWALPAAMLAILCSLYALNPTESNPISRGIFLSYKLPQDPDADPAAPAQYGKGKWDFAFVAFYTVVLSFTREFVMQEILRPLGRYAGIRSKGKMARFMEQMYTAVYFSLMGPVGIWIMSRTPVWYFNTRGMYENFPHKTHEAAFKFYYLFQAAYWFQQAIVLVLGLEKPRKDFKELIAHHVVSLALIWLSYRFHFTYIGLAVYVTHDISDFFLATSKSLNYIDHWSVSPYFFIFMCVWVYMRHYLNLRIIWSLFTEFRTVGPYELDWETEQYKCVLSNVITIGLLSALQALNLFWLFFILRIAYRVVFFKIVEDDRSDAEESDVEGPAAEEKEKEKEKERDLVGAMKQVNGVATAAVAAAASGRAPLLSQSEVDLAGGAGEAIAEPLLRVVK